jgi:hypothetical protein
VFSQHCPHVLVLSFFVRRPLTFSPHSNIRQIYGKPLDFLDIGGGLAVAYRFLEQQTLVPRDYAQALKTTFAGFPRKWKLLLEPGRWIVANAGVLVSEVHYGQKRRMIMLYYIEWSDFSPVQVLHVKHTSPDAPRFLIVDAAMNDMVRVLSLSLSRRMWNIVIVCVHAAANGRLLRSPSDSACTVSSPPRNYSA